MAGTLLAVVGVSGLVVGILEAVSRRLTAANVVVARPFPISLVVGWALAAVGLAGGVLLWVWAFMPP